ncbi:hypothetical protein [Chakrabartyella piscis]|uniref:YczE/YyaS/YitT family protein n=1 Tax=Chakrabartyella piscis TaxID=2918914 RepID=UPI00295841CD|nr:hypothetical protein [Chakrabartyella piscis]
MNEKKMRIIMAIAGVVICALGIAFCKCALLGTDPFQCFLAGIDNIIPLSFGTVHIIINVLLLILMLAVGRKYMGVATFVNIFLLGYMVEFFMYGINSMFDEVTLLLQIVYLAIGILVLCLSLALYFTADLGVSAYDFIALLLEEKGVAKFKYCRIATDLICVVAGFFLNAVIGVGTLITAFFMGPLVAYLRSTIAEPLLAKYQD